MELKLKCLPHRNSTDNYTLGRDSPAKKLKPGGLIPYEIAVCSRGNPLTVGVQIRNVSIKGQGAPGGPLVGGIYWELSGRVEITRSAWLSYSSWSNF